MSLSQQLQAVEARLRAGDLSGAALACRTLTEASPDYAPGWATACRVALASARPAQAVEYAERALTLAPEHARLLILTAVALRAAGADERADATAANAAMRCASDAISWQELGSYYSAAGAFPAALASFTRAVELDPRSTDFRFNRATLLRITGELAEAEREYDRLIAQNPGEYEAYYNRADLRRQSQEKNHVAELKSMLDKGVDHPRGEVFVRQALAKELEDLGEYRRSFDQVKRAASLRRQHLHYDVQRDVDTAAWIAAAFSAERLGASSPGQPSDAPIFIVGMPRTGTTLLERILGQHSEVFAAGELPHFANALTEAATRLRGVKQLSRRDLIEASAELDMRSLGDAYLARAVPGTGNRAHFTDKLPLNYLYCGPIHQALPHARLIHLTRHPMDTCYAIYKTLFKDAYPFSYDFCELARYYAAYRRLMQHWHAAMPGVILEVSYEGLVTQLESETRRILAHCGLEWQASCGEFHRNPNPTATASAAQVRRPLYDTSIGLWERYENELQPLRDALVAEGVSAQELHRRA